MPRGLRLGRGSPASRRYSPGLGPSGMGLWTVVADNVSSEHEKSQPHQDRDHELDDV